MPFTIPVPAGEPDIAVPAFGAGEAAAAAVRFLEARGADPLPALDWLAEGAGRLAGELEAALSYAGIACDRVLDRYRRQP